MSDACRVAPPAAGWIGRPVERVDGTAKVTGEARYAAEYAPPGLLFAALVTSTIAAGRIIAVDIADAARADGVVRVITHLDAPRLPFAEPDPRPSVYPVSGRRLRVLQDELVLYSGQPVAVVIADTQGRARDAATLVKVTYDADAAPLTAFDVGQARPTSSAAAAKGRGPSTEQGTPDAALAHAPIRVDETYEQSRNLHSAMEPHVTVAQWDGDHLLLWDKSQWVQNVADEMALTFGIPHDNVRVINPYVGGAFGSALRPWPHTTLAALAARVVDRPVRLELTRRQLATSIGYRPRAWQRVALGADRSGTLLAQIHEAVSETSVFEEFADPTLAPAGASYAGSNRRTSYRLVHLNTNTPCPMRAPGWATGLFGQEVAMDELAVALAMDPVEVRLRNFADTNPTTGLPWASNELRACYRQGAERFGWHRREPAARSMRTDNVLVGLGMATAVYTAARYPTSASAEVTRDAIVVVRCATTDMGPGTYTSMTQVAADALRLPLERVRFELGDTTYAAAMEHGGSTTMASVGSAVLAASDDLRHRLDELDPAGSSDTDALLRQAAELNLSVTARSEPGTEQTRYSHHCFGAVFAEVHVDPLLGLITVARLVGAYDGGRIINPRIARQQCLGGMVGGIGMALTERLDWDPRYGRPMSATLADYHVPVNANVVDLDAVFVEAANPLGNPLGVKGVAELGICGVAPAIANAVWHATGVRVRRIPILPDHVLT